MAAIGTKFIWFSYCTSASTFFSFLFFFLLSSVGFSFMEGFSCLAGSSTFSMKSFALGASFFEGSFFLNFFLGCSVYSSGLASETFSGSATFDF
jgi:hypothetical protein